MDWSLTYILSQVFTIIMYIFLAMTYYSKDRKKVLILNFIGLLSIGTAYFLLKAWPGFAMNIVAIIRNTIFLVDEAKKGKRDKVNKLDIAILIFLGLMTIAFGILSFESIWGLFSVFATLLYTYSVWQKNTRIYKLLGIPIETMWIIYNIHIKSLFGVILESIIVLFAISGYFFDKQKDIVKE